MFMSQRLRSRIKPALEMMEALPGVVVGFIAGLVMAPWIERHLAMVLLLFLVLPLGILLAAAAWRRSPSVWRSRLPLSRAGLWLLPWLLVLVLLTLQLS